MRNQGRTAHTFKSGRVGGIVHDDARSPVDKAGHQEPIGGLAVIGEVAADFAAAVQARPVHDLDLHFVCKLGPFLAAIPPITGRLQTGYHSITAILISAGAARYSSMSPVPLAPKLTGLTRAGRSWGPTAMARGAMALSMPGALFTPLDVPGAFATAAVGINSRGQIVGFYVDSTGEHGFLATPTKK